MSSSKDTLCIQLAKGSEVEKLGANLVWAYNKSKDLFFTHRGKQGALAAAKKAEDAFFDKIYETYPQLVQKYCGVKARKNGTNYEYFLEIPMEYLSLEKHI